MHRLCVAGVAKILVASVSCMHDEDAYDESMRRRGFFLDRSKLSCVWWWKMVDKNAFVRVVCWLNVASDRFVAHARKTNPVLQSVRMRRTQWGVFLMIAKWRCFCVVRESPVLAVGVVE